MNCILAFILIALWYSVFFIHGIAGAVAWASERWAYDLVIEPADMGSKNLEDYGIYNEEIISPVSGIIVAAYDDENDILPNTEEFLSIEGNHVYIKIDKTGSFLMLNHLKKDSVLVKVGEHVNEGDIIGRVTALF